MKPKGFYKESNSQQLSQIYIPKQTVRKTKFHPYLKSELAALNCLILKHLKSCSSKSPIIKCQMEPCHQLIHFLKKNYNIKNKYMNASQIINDLSFQVKRFYNQRDFCTILTDENGIMHFKLKLAKSRILTYFSNQYLEKKKTSYKNILHLLFIVDDQKIN